MRFQHVSVMFVIIFIPIILVTSYFISLQVNTIKLETSYDDKLLNATYDAMTAFELNTANENLSTVSDSLRSIITASNNIFFNTLCTNLGVSNASKSYIQPFVPVILYTLYDGYYIYSPTNVPEICVDKYGQTIRTSDFGVSYDGTVTLNDGKKIGVYKFEQKRRFYDNDSKTEAISGDTVNYNFIQNKEEYGQILYKNINGTYSTTLHTITGGNSDKSTYYKRDYILKSYIPYSATYVHDNINITVNYTLDNFITLEGNIGNVYYTKSGYLIDKNLVKKITIKYQYEGEEELKDWTQYSQEILDSCIKDPDNYEVKVYLDDDIIISNRDGTITYRNGSEYKLEYWDDAQSAVQYYVDSYIFSEWVYQNLKDIKASDILNKTYSVSDIQENVSKSIKKSTDLYKDMLHDFVGDNSKPFEPVYETDSEDTIKNPENRESIFATHKRNIIKNSITYNLILSMLVYTEESRTVEYNMPVLKEEEWSRILNNVSITAFMQGMRCGLKYYNNYAIVTSTNNEIAIDENEIYYVPREVQSTTKRNDDGEVENVYILTNLEDDENSNPKGILEQAHRIDCKDLKVTEQGCISFKSKEIKYDKILNSDGTFRYDHKVYTDYNCIVDSNYTVKNTDGSEMDGNTYILDYLRQNSKMPGSTLEENNYFKLKSYRIAVAKERNNLYKTTAFPENYGYTPIVFSYDYADPGGTIGALGLDNKKIKEIKKIEVTIDNVSTSKLGSYTDDIEVYYNNDETNLKYDNKTIGTNSTNALTLEYEKDFGLTDELFNNITVQSKNGTIFKLRSIKFYYK